MAGEWKIDAGRLWAAGVTTALVAGLAAVVVWFFAEQVFSAQLMVTPLGGGELQDLTVARSFGVAFAVAIVATALLHLLLLGVPSATTFFTWIGVLFLFASLIPIAGLDAGRDIQAWLLGMHAAVFIAVVPTLVTVVQRVVIPVPPAPPMTPRTR